MSDNQQLTPTTINHPPQENIPQTNKRCHANKKCWLVSGLLLLILAMSLTGLWCWQQLVQKRALQQRHETQLAAFGKQLNQLHQQQNALAQQQALLSRQTQNSKKLELLEANHLFRLAIIKLNFSRDIPSTILLLQLVEQRLQSATLANANDLRLALAKNIADLQAVPNINIAALLIKLQALSEQVPSLPLFIAPQTMATIPGATVEQSRDITHQTWRQTLQANLEKLRGFIVIRRLNEPVTPLLAPEQQYYLKQNLQLLLQQTAWAAMQGQTAVYQANLQQALQWIDSYFAKDAPAIKSLVTNLNELKNIELQSPLPDITPTLQLIQQQLTQQQEG